ncbi:SDR family oxidoreductase [Chryseobacterium sp. MMS23-Vi53]|uniref:SDR family oxidoreductase n=1 Tax=Chryseobacterium sp. MMS23-Vi53 TaxID=3386644 RepID=UPI0039EC4731
MYPELKGKVALITGASKGIGKGIAEKLASEGLQLILNYSSDEKAALETARLMDDYKINYQMIKADVSNPSAIEELFQQVLAKFGRLDIVIANAGIEMVDKPFTDYTENDFDKIYNLNVKGTFFVMQQAAKHITDGGRIILISSTQSLNAESGAAVYASSKSAGKKFVDILSKELGHRGITVNSVMPGVIDQAGVIANISEEFKQLVRDNSPFGRLGNVQDIGKVVAFLASDEAGYINGAHIKANGGSSF